MIDHIWTEHEGVVRCELCGEIADRPQQITKCIPERIHDLVYEACVAPLEGVPQDDERWSNYGEEEEE
jgi:hypothetical protein